MIETRWNQTAQLKEAAMRRLLVLGWLIGLGSQGFAGDFDVPTLRGATAYAPPAPEFSFVPGVPTYRRWSGPYAGGSFGYGMSNMDFSGASRSLLEYQLRLLTLENEQHVSQWPVLGRADNHSTTYGGFVGYNSQWDDVVLGVELNYNSSNYFANVPGQPLSRLVPAGGNTYAVTVDGSASMRITDYGAAKVRAGYIMNTFMPYVTAGFAFGRADVARSARVFGAENPPAGYPAVPCDPLAGCVAFDYSSSESKKAAWIYGWTIGGGVDYMLLQNVFLRTEVEHSDFAKTFGIKSTVTTGRVGAGIKF
jgi:opacity protein-like surface antigen